MITDEKGTICAPERYIGELEKGIKRAVAMLAERDARIVELEKKNDGLREALFNLSEFNEPEASIAKRDAEIGRLKSALQEACDLLHHCLEWDNGGERSYEAICSFVNKHDKHIAGG